MALLYIASFLGVFPQMRSNYRDGGFKGICLFIFHNFHNFCTLYYYFRVAFVIFIHLGERHKTIGLYHCRKKSYS